MRTDKTKTILVTGGTGTTGRLVAEGLRKACILPRIATRKPSGENDILFDWQQPESARRAFDGVYAMYIVAPTSTSDHGTVVPPILDIALSSGVQRFVLLSASSLEAGGPMMGQIHAYLAASAPEWTVLRPTWFLQNFSQPQHQQTIRQENAIYSATGSGRIGFIDANDIARAAVSALLEDRSWNRDFILTGPETLSYAQIASKLSSILDRPIRYVKLSVEQLAERHRAGGLDRDYAELLASMDKWIEEGHEDRLTDGVLTLTQQAPTPADAFIRANIKSWLS